MKKGFILAAGPLWISGKAGYGRQAAGFGGGTARPLPGSEPPPPGIPGVDMIMPGLYEVEGERPLDVAAELLQRKLGVAISWEEPAWLASSLPVPRGGRLGALSLPAREMRPENAASVIQRVIDRHMAADHPARFALLRHADDQFGIVPTKVANDEGLLVDRPSPLASPISFPEQDRTLAETLDLIYDQASSVAGRTMFAFDASPLARLRVRIGAANEVARDVLARVLRIPGGPMLSWRLRYEPSAGIFLVFLSPVEHEVPAANGGSRLEPVLWPPGDRGRGRTTDRSRL